MKWLLFASIVVLAACATMPETSRTGAVHDVRIEEGLTPERLEVAVGDEVRWINGRTLAVRLEFLPEDLEGVRCQTGFASLLGRVTRVFGQVSEMAVLEPNQAASLCFGREGIITYNVRAESALSGGSEIVPGIVAVGALAR